MVIADARFQIRRRWGGFGNGLCATDVSGRRLVATQPASSRRLLTTQRASAKRGIGLHMLSKTDLNDYSDAVALLLLLATCWLTLTNQSPGVGGTG
jgi:hypothetical protein